MDDIERSRELFQKILDKEKERNLELSRLDGVSGNLTKTTYPAFLSRVDAARNKFFNELEILFDEIEVITRPVINIFISEVRAELEILGRVRSPDNMYVRNHRVVLLRKYLEKVQRNCFPHKPLDEIMVTLNQFRGELAADRKVIKKGLPPLPMPPDVAAE